MQTLTAYGQAGADALRNEIEQLKFEKEKMVHDLANIHLKIGVKQTRLRDLVNDLNKSENNIRELHQLKYGQETGAINGGTNKIFNVGANLDATTTGRGPVFHEQNDAVDSH